MAKCYFIDATSRAISEVDYEVNGGVQKLLSGYLEVAYHWPNGDTLYVDEEGLLKYRHGFSFMLRPDQPLSGSGVLVGREVEGSHYPGGFTTLHPTIKIEDVRQMVRFLADWRREV